jgi:regulator of protease activity HflC (stomatin/prohibitin superfamily)
MKEVIIALIVLLFLVVLVIVPNIKILSKNHAMVIERFGTFLKIIDEPGVYILIPLFDRAIQVVCLDEMERKFTFSMASENDTITYMVDYHYQVTDVKLFVYSALDALSVFEKKIKYYLTNFMPIDDKIFHELKEHAENFGIELKSIISK